MERIPVLSTAALRVLVVDEEPGIRRFLNSTLGHSFEVSEAETGQNALGLASSKRHDLVILDLGLPDMNGTDLTRRLREWTDVPVIVISDRDREEDKIAVLDAGADDYLTKPFSAGELMARIRSIMRRSSKPAIHPVYQNADLMVDLEKHEVRVRGSYVALTRTEYSILRSLVVHAGRVLTHQQLIQEVWNGSYARHAHLLRVNISNLRKKIESDPLEPRYILTEPGVGYRLQDAVHETNPSIKETE